MRSRRAILDAEQLALAVGDDDDDGTEGGRGSDRGGGAEYSFGAGSKKSKKKGGGGRGGWAEPGPPVEGASLRVDSWPQECDATGALLGPVSERRLVLCCGCCRARGPWRALPPRWRPPPAACQHACSHPLQEHGPRPSDFPLSLTRKDAAAFVKAAKQRGVIAKLDDICKGAHLCLHAPLLPCKRACAVSVPRAAATAARAALPSHPAASPLLLPADAGGLVESASERARLALWFGLQVCGWVHGPAAGLLQRAAGDGARGKMPAPLGVVPSHPP